MYFVLCSTIIKFILIIISCNEMLVFSYSILFYSSYLDRWGKSVAELEQQQKKEATLGELI